MNPRIKIALASIGMLLLGVGGFMALKATKPEPPAKEAEQVRAVVRVQKIETGEFTATIAESGTVAPKTSIDITAEVSGRIVHVADNLKVGYFVNEGELLIEIDPREYKLSVAQSQAQIAQLQAEMAQTQQTKENLKRNLEVEEDKLKLSRSELERMKELQKTGSISQSELDKQAISTRQMEASVVNQQNSLALLRSQMDLIEAKLEATRAQLDMAKLKLEKTRIIAPFNGRVREESVEENQFAQVGAKLATIYDISAMEIVINLPLRTMRKWHPGNNGPPLPPITDMVKANEWMKKIGPKGTVRLSIGDTYREWTGRVTRLKGALDETTRTIPVVVEVEEPFKGVEPGKKPPLVPGMFVEVKLEGRTFDNVVAIPRSALHGEDKVYVAKDNKLEIRDVALEMLTREHAVISKGLKDGDLLILSPIAVPIPGTALRIASES
jgi:RND family efflux transporter MFP subunit